MSNSKYSSRDPLSAARLNSFMQDDGLAYQQRLLSGSARSSSSSTSRGSAQPSYSSSSYYSSSSSSYGSSYYSYGSAQPQPRPRQ
ncbi:unnamed protein product [Clonostachys rhizophaga]|uniref:Uncharacterized protein n=1 Tax=Clonostachys rhizophaga TaxID=160324 RepID=A0A9N9VEY1_9HYPO|nr:unnamed protein product [Clonostachys rhizophaga]